HGPVPEGRRMFLVTADETLALAHERGLATVHRAHGGDPLGRADVTWSHLVLERGRAATRRPPAAS
ncbi:hypothetical protein JNW98_35250, partial [Streptomyces sp. SCA2-4]|nr:hypothetical protein [Streptomyces huiliensis]